MVKGFLLCATVLHSGVIGSENMDSIDIPEKDFIPLTVRRTVLPPDTPTAQYVNSEYLYSILM